MARIVAAMALTHSPGLTGWFDRAPEEQQKTALRALAEMRQRLEAARPDVVIAFSNDHLLNWPINNTRSEEHTSELQSLAYLVCRLLLEKKKKIVRHLISRHL